MKKNLVLVLALILIMGMVPAFADDATPLITIGKKFDVSGKTFPEGHDVENYNYYLDYAEEMSGVDIAFSWILLDDTQKAALAVASGSMPDVMIVNQTTYNMLLESDMLMDLTDIYAEKAPGTILEQVYEVYPKSFAAGTVNGRLMALPNAVSQYENCVLWVRQDWLTALGLEAPTTLEELEAVARAFVEQDPDGNGEDDTIGMALYSAVFTDYNDSNSANSIATLYGAYPQMWYMQDDGSVIYGSIASGTRDALEYLAMLYQEGLIDQEFAVHDADELIVSGKCGISYGRWAYTTNQLRQSHAYDGADWIPVLCPLDGDGIYYARFRNPASSYVVISKDCENPGKVLDIIINEYTFHWEIGLDEQWQAKRDEYSEMNVAWSTMPIAIQLERTAIVEERANAFAQYLSTGSVEGLSKQVQGFIESYENYLADPTQLTGWAWLKGMYQCGILTTSDRCEYTEPCFWGTTTTMGDSWASLQAMEEETFVKIVMGESDIEAFDTFVEQWKALGGDTITEEVQVYVNTH